MGPRRKRPARRHVLLERLAARLHAELRKIRKDSADAEAVHDARVAARRLLATGEYWASQAPSWGRLRDRVSRVLKKLGRLRNFDVTLRHLDRGPDSERLERKALARHLRKLRRKERRAVGAWLTRDRIGRIRTAASDLADEVRKVPELHRPGPESLAPQFSRIVGLFSGSLQGHRMHQARREVRRLRYAHETLQDAYPPAEFRRAADLLRRVQELAGAWHDRCVLGEFAVKAAREEHVAVPLASLMGRVEGEARLLLGRFLRAAAELSELRGLVVGESA